MKGTISGGGGIIELKKIFSKTLKHFKNSEICYHQSTQVFLQSIGYSRQILIKQIFENSSSIEIYENPYRESRVVGGGRTGRQAGIKKLTVIFSNSAKTHKNKQIIYYVYLFICETRIYIVGKMQFPYNIFFTVICSVIASATNLLTN